MYDNFVLKNTDFSHFDIKKLPTKQYPFVSLLFSKDTARSPTIMSSIRYHTTLSFIPGRNAPLKPTSAAEVDVPENASAYGRWYPAASVALKNRKIHAKDYRTIKLNTH